MGRGALDIAQRPIPLHLGSAESGVDRRCEIAKTAMRPHRVVIVLPDCQYFAGMGKGCEQRLVEAFVPQPPVEGLYVAAVSGSSETAKISQTNRLEELSGERLDEGTTGGTGSCSSSLEAGSDRRDPGRPKVK